MTVNRAARGDAVLAHVDRVDPDLDGTANRPGLERALAGLDARIERASRTADNTGLHRSVRGKAKFELAELRQQRAGLESLLNDPDYAGFESFEARPHTLEQYEVVADLVGDRDRRASNGELARLQRGLARIDDQLSSPLSAALNHNGLSAAAMREALGGPAWRRERGRIEAAADRQALRDVVLTHANVTADDGGGLRFDESRGPIAARFAALATLEHTGAFLDRDHSGELTPHEALRGIESVDVAIEALGERRAAGIERYATRGPARSRSASPARAARAEAQIDEALGRLRSLRDDLEKVVSTNSSLRYMEPAFYELPDDDRSTLLQAASEFGERGLFSLEDGRITNSEVNGLVGYIDRVVGAVQGRPAMRNRHLRAEFRFDVDELLTLKSRLLESLESSPKLRAYLGREGPMHPPPRIEWSWGSMLTYRAPRVFASRADAESFLENTFYTRRNGPERDPAPSYLLAPADDEGFVLFAYVETSAIQNFDWDDAGVTIRGATPGMLFVDHEGQQAEVTPDVLGNASLTGNGYRYGDARVYAP